jgi:hypothetical protein
MQVNDQGKAPGDNLSGQFVKDYPFPDFQITNDPDSQLANLSSSRPSFAAASWNPFTGSNIQIPATPDVSSSISSVQPPSQ